jgi:hypothetical protein
MTNAEMDRAMEELRASVAGSKADRELQERRDAESRTATRGQWPPVRPVRIGDWTQDPNIGRN